MMRFGAYDFSPSLWPTLATVLLVPIMTGLGVWQLERASWKQELVDNNADRSHLPPVSLESLDEYQDTHQYRKVFVRGYYDMDHQLLLDNRTHEGHAGYHVLTPLRMADSDKTVLVNRGWVPVGSSRDVLPDIPGTRGEILVDATFMVPAEKIFRLGASEEQHEGWPQVVQQIELKGLEQRLGYPLQPLILLLDKDDEFGFIRDWKVVYGVTPEKHRAYAMQWFTLAVVLLIIYIGVNSKRIPHED
jgi:surfeit locus 1 family protein